LVDRQDAASRLPLGRDHAVDLGERAGERLLADDLLAGLERRQHLLAMQPRRRAEIDDIDVRHAEEFIKRGGAPRDRESIGEPHPPRFVDIADRDHAKLVGVLPIPLGDVAAADAAANDADGEDPAIPHHRSSAKACAFKASSIALKHRACGIAVSVRCRMSARSCRP
jgi:hypothetical protein